MTEQQIKENALRIGLEEAAKVRSALEQCRTRADIEKVCRDLRVTIQRVFNEQLTKSGETIDCRAGCFFCCSMKVDVTPWDIFPIVEFLQSHFSKEQIQEIHDKAKSNREKIKPFSYEQQEAAIIPCPLLKDGKCMVYDLRPLMCRRHHSHKVAYCEKAYKNPEAEGPVAKVQEVDLTVSAVLGLSVKAFEAAGYDAHAYDLSSALDEALSNPKCNKRWRDKKSAFPREIIAKEPERKGGAFHP